MLFRLVIIGLLPILINACDKPPPVPQYSAEVFNPKWMAGTVLPGSGTFLLVGEQGSIARSGNGSDWSYAQTPLTHTLYDIASDTEGKVLIAVGDAGTILRSVDDGGSWQLPAVDVPEGSNFSATRLKTVMHAAEGDVWLVAGTQNAILRSVDQGKNWRLVSYNTSDAQLEILALFNERSTGDILFAAQHGTTGRSNDGGANWHIVRHDMQTTGNYIPHIVGFHQHGDTLIATADLGRLLVSQNGGKTWQLNKLPTAGYFTDSAYDPAHKALVLTTQMGEIARSTDGGKTWQLATPNVANWPGDDIPLLSSVLYDNESKSFLAVGNSGVVLRSTDGGASWHGGALKSLLNRSVTTLLHAPEKDLFVLTGLGGFIATANGLENAETPLSGWELVRPGIDQYIREVVHIPDNDTFIAVGQLGGIWRSDNDGRDWNFVEMDYPHPNQPPHLRDLIVGSTSGVLLAAGPAGSIIRSPDNGVTWQPVFQGAIAKGEAFTQILVDEKRRTLLTCEVLYRSVYRSSDDGASWRKVAAIDAGGSNLWHGAVSRKHDLVMVVGQLGAIAISRDGGDNWHMAETPVKNDLYGAFADDKSGTLFAVGHNGIILRSEEGYQWQKVESHTLHTLRRIVAEPETGALLAFGQGGTVVRSTDTGRSWEQMVTPVQSGELRKALLEPDTGNPVIVGRDGLILRSVDQGKTWQKLSSHTNQHFRSAAFNPATGTLIAVGDGLVRLERQ